MPVSYDSVYVRGSEALVIEFNDIDVTNCDFTLAVLNITVSNQAPIDKSIATLIQPDLIPIPNEEELFTVSDFGKLIV